MKNDNCQKQLLICKEDKMERGRYKSPSTKYFCNATALLLEIELRPSLKLLLKQKKSRFKRVNAIFN